MRLRVVSIRAVSRSERGSGARMSLRWYTFIYLSERSETRRLARVFVSGKINFLLSLPLIDIPESFFIYWIYLSLNT